MHWARKALSSLLLTSVRPPPAAAVLLPFRVCGRVGGAGRVHVLGLANIPSRDPGLAWPM